MAQHCFYFSENIYYMIEPVLYISIEDSLFIIGGNYLLDKIVQVGGFGLANIYI